MIYIQSDDLNRIPHHFDTACAMYGAIDLGLKYKLVSFADIQLLPLSNLARTNMFVGSVEFMNFVFGKMGKDKVSLPLNSNRDSVVLPLSQVKSIINSNDNHPFKVDNQMFIKPYEHIKLFTGFVLDKANYVCLNNISDDTLCRVYKPFPYHIKSEWRTYVHRAATVASQNYSGDFRITPDWNMVSDVVKEYSNILPLAYTIDVAVLADGSTHVVEFNDMWAIGNYGIPNDMYLRMLRDRYFDIVKS